MKTTYSPLKLVLYGIASFIIGVIMIGTAIHFFKPGLEKKSVDYGSVKLPGMPLTPSNKFLPTEKTSAIDTSSNLYKDVIADVEASEYHINASETNGVLQSPNRVHNLRIKYRPGIVSMEPGVKGKKGKTWRAILQTKGIYADGKLLYKPQVDAVEYIESNRVVYNHEGLYKEEYINSQEGLRQNFIINNAPAKGAKELRVKLKLSGLNIEGASKNRLVFTNEKKEKVIDYQDIKAWDAQGKLLTAYIEKENENNFALVAKVEGAAYPITIDPLATTRDWFVGGGQTNGQMGYSVASAGDVNGDGYIVG